MGLQDSLTALTTAIGSVGTALDSELHTDGIQGGVKNFKSAVPGANSYAVNVSADEVILENSNGLFHTVRNVALVLNANSIVGAPLGIMATRALSTWYYRWLWYNPSLGLTGTLDPSLTAPTTPTGYTATDYKCCLPGASLTDSSVNQFLMQLETTNKISHYVVAASSNVPVTISMATGPAATNTAINVSPFVPVGLACEIHVELLVDTSQDAVIGANTAGTAILGGQSSSGGSLTFADWIVLESNNLYWTSSGGANNARVLGWRDN